MGKRAATKVAAVAASPVKTAKKAKVEPTVDPAFASVGDAVMEAEQIPERVRSMLVGMMPFSLKFASDERHELQDFAVNMVDQTLTGKKSALEAAVAAEDGALNSLKASESQLGVTVIAAEAALAQAKDAAAAKKTAKEEATATEKASAATLKEKRAEEKTGQQKADQMVKEKAAIETAFAEHFPPIQEGEGSKHFKKLEPFLQKIQVESTLLSALPSAANKATDKRGTFDVIVLQETEKAFKVKIAALGEEITAEGPASEQRQAAAQAAEKDHDTAKAAKEQAASESDAANKEEKERTSALKEAKKAVDDFVPKVAEVTGRLAKAQEVLAEFENGPFKNFVDFKTRVAAVPEEPAAEEAAAEEAPAEAAEAAAE